MIVKYKLLGQYVNPVNSREIELEINHDQEAIINQPKPHVGINNLYFAREDIQKIMAYLNDITKPGITEGVPFDIEITEKNQTETINMYLNLMDGFKRSNDGIETSVKMLQSLDWMEDKVDGFTFESMYNEPAQQVIIDSILYTSYQDFFDKRVIFIPYVLSTIPNEQAAITSLASIIAVAIQWFQSIMHLAQQAAYLAGVLTTIPGAIALALEVAFAILLTLALIALINQLINCLIQPIKYHGAMLLIDMLKVVSHKMGLTFQSSWWNIFPYNQIAYLPEKYNPQDNFEPDFHIFAIPVSGFQQTGFVNPGYGPATGTPPSSDISVQKGYFNGMGSDFFRLVKRICNGKIIIPDQTNTLLLERRDYYPAGTPYQLPDIRQDWNGYNTDELFANTLLEFEADLNDKNCIDKYIGTIVQATHQQVITANDNLVNLKGLREIKIPAARGIAKKSLSFVEEIVKNIKSITHAFGSLFGQSSTISSQTNPRINCLLLENDMVTTPKLLLVDIARSEFTASVAASPSGQARIAYLHAANDSIINAQWLWSNFYSIDSFVGTVNNRFTKISPALNKASESNPCLLSVADFKNLVSNPQFNDNFAEPVIADSIKWRIGDESGRAIFDFRKAGWLRNPQSMNGAIRSQEININLQMKISVPNGQ